MAVKKLKLPNNTTVDINDARVVSDGITYIGDTISSATYESEGIVVDLSDYQPLLVSGTNIKTINNQSLLGSGNISISSGGGGGGEENVIEIVKVNGTALTPDANKAVDIPVPAQITSSELIGSMSRNDVSGSGNLTVKNTIGAFPTVAAGTYIVKTFASSTTSSYTLSISFGGNTYSLTSSNGIVNDSRELTFSSSATWSGSITTVNSSSTLIVRVYSEGSIVTTVGIAAVSNDYGDLDNKPTIPTDSTVSGWGYIKTYTETDPTVPSWAKASTKPTYTASEVGALPDTTVIPTVPTISTNITSDATSDTKTASPKAVKTYVDGIVGDIETLLAAI